MVQASGQDASWTSPWGGFLGMRIRKETLGQTKYTLERLSLGWFGSILVSLPEELAEVAGERSGWISLLRLLPL